MSAWFIAIGSVQKLCAFMRLAGSDVTVFGTRLFVGCCILDYSAFCGAILLGVWAGLVDAKRRGLSRVDQL